MLPSPLSIQSARKSALWAPGQPMAGTFSENSHDNLRVEGPTSEMVFLPADAYSSNQNISELTNIINSTHYVHIRISTLGHRL